MACAGSRERAPMTHASSRFWKRQDCDDSSGLIEHTGDWIEVYSSFSLFQGRFTSKNNKCLTHTRALAPVDWLNVDVAL